MYPHVFDDSVMRLVLAVALGMFLGLEREWANKSAGIRTFSLVSLTGAVFARVDEPVLLALGGVLVIIQSVLLAAPGLSTGGDNSLALTTSVSLLVTYGVGVLVGTGYLPEGVTVAVLSSLLLVLRKELHQFAHNLSKEEVKSAAEFAILAFVIYPFLPTEVTGPWGPVNPREVWLLVVAISGIGFVNYVIMQVYGNRGMALTGFLGGLVNSTAVIGELANRVRQHPELANIAVGAILLADAAMAIRNMVLIVGFVPALAVPVGFPLLVIGIVGVVIAFLACDWDGEFDIDLDSPFSVTSALKFGLLMFIIILIASGAQQTYGAVGFIVTSFLSGLVSSGTSTMTAVLFANAGQISHEVAAAAVVAGTTASILVKVVAAASFDRTIFRGVAMSSLFLVVAGGLALVITATFA